MPYTALSSNKMIGRRTHIVRDIVTGNTGHTVEHEPRGITAPSFSPHGGWGVSAPRIPLTKSQQVAARKAGMQLGDIDWGSMIGKLADSAVTFGVAKLNQGSQAATAELAQLQAAQAAKAAAPKAAASSLSKMLPLLLGGAGLLGGVFFLLRRRR